MSGQMRTFLEYSWAISGQRAGIDVYAATYGFRGREKLAQLNPTGLFDSFAELRDILK